MSHTIVPIFDTIIDKFPKEKWKDIPGFEGLYQLSNYGRVKSLSRWVYSENKADAFRPGRIIKLRFTPNSKKKKRNENDIDIQMKLHKESFRYQFSVARYVYFLFVAQFDLAEHTVIIRRKDGNKLNSHYQNLVLSSISDVAKEGFATNKRKSEFQEQVKQVSQYSPEGKFLATFPSAKQAAKSAHTSSQYINDAARTKSRTAAGFYWRYGKPTQYIKVTIYKDRISHTLRTQRRGVQQFSLTGQHLRTFDSVSQAANAVGLPSGTNISYACKGKLKTSKGFIWKYV